MSDDANLVERVLREHGITKDDITRVTNRREWNAAKMDLQVMGTGILTGQPGNEEEYIVDKAQKAIKQAMEKQAKEQKTQGILRILHQGKGQDIYLRVIVDTGADINAITSGMVLDCHLNDFVIELEEPFRIDLAVGSVHCHEMVSVPWMAKNNEMHGKSDFYVLPHEQGNIIDWAILSKEWLMHRDRLYDEDERHNLKPLIGGKPPESEEAAMVKVRQQAENDRASSAKAKDAQQKRKGQKGQEGASKGSPHPKEAGK